MSDECLPWDDDSRDYEYSKIADRWAHPILCSDGKRRDGTPYGMGEYTLISKKNPMGREGADGTRWRCFKQDKTYPQDLKSRADCCLGMNESECDPNYCADSKKCSGVLRSYCSEGDNIGDYRCGFLKNSTDENEVRTYGTLIDRYCRNVDNIKTDTCVNHFAENLDKYTDLIRSTCATRHDEPGWQSFCACHKPKSFYETLSKSIAALWGGPAHAMSSKPECIYPACNSSKLARQDAYCGNVSFAKCIQNVNVDLTDATVGDLQLKQTAGCAGSFKKKSPPSDYYDQPPSDDYVPPQQPYVPPQQPYVPPQQPYVPPQQPYVPPPKDDDSFMENLKSNRLTQIMVFILIVFISMGVVLMGGDDSKSISGGLYNPIIQNINGNEW
jgi:hypothetical protein